MEIITFGIHQMKILMFFQQQKLRLNYQGFYFINLRRRLIVRDGVI